MDHASATKNSGQDLDVGSADINHKHVHNVIGFYLPGLTVV